MAGIHTCTCSHHVLFTTLSAVSFLSDSANHVVKYACSSLGNIARAGPFPVTLSGKATDAKLVIDKLKQIIKETTDIHVSVLYFTYMYGKGVLIHVLVITVKAFKYFCSLCY